MSVLDDLDADASDLKTFLHASGGDVESVWYCLVWTAIGVRSSTIQTNIWRLDQGREIQEDGFWDSFVGKSLSRDSSVIQRKGHRHIVRHAGDFLT